MQVLTFPICLRIDAGSNFSLQQWQVTFNSPWIWSRLLVDLYKTGKSLSETLIFASINPNMATDCSWNYHEKYKRRTWVEHVLLMLCVCSFHGNSMNNLLSYCGLVDARISASEKDLPVQNIFIILFFARFIWILLRHKSRFFYSFFFLLFLFFLKNLSFFLFLFLIICV